MKLSIHSFIYGCMCNQVIVFGAVLAAAGTFVMAFAPNVPVLFAAVVLSYVGAALVYVPGKALTRG